MPLDWITKIENSLPGAAQASDREYTIYQANAEGKTAQSVQHAIERSIDKACDLLKDNIEDDSRFLLFGWNAETSTLTILVSDDEKYRDSQGVVQCQLTANGLQLDPEDIQFWIKDYLSTCAPFLRYSLIAAFHRGSRANCTLL